jgi:hypothetical protein
MSISNMIWKKIKPYIADTIFAIILIGAIILYWIYMPLKSNRQSWQYTSIQNIILLVTIFFGWIQFIFYKWNKKKEAALTYFPKPLELEQLENDIDKVINFWSSDEPLEPFVVSIMIGEDNDNINECHYKIIWNRFTIDIQKNIIDKFDFNIENTVLKRKYYKYKIDEKTNKYKFSSDYIPWIKQELLNVRRKLNAYLNQIEGYCLSINTGNIASKSAALLFGYKFKKHFNKSFPYIEKVRRKSGDKNLYIEFEKIVKEWDNI